MVEEEEEEGSRKVSNASSYSLQTATRRSWTSLTALRSSSGVEDGPAAAAESDAPLSWVWPFVRGAVASGMMLFVGDRMREVREAVARVWWRQTKLLMMEGDYVMLI